MDAKYNYLSSSSSSSSQLFLSLLLFNILYKNDFTESASLWDTVKSYRNASIFVNYIQEVDYRSILENATCTSSTTCYTLLLPSNDAMNSISDELDWSRRSELDKILFVSGHILHAYERSPSSAGLTTKEWNKLGKVMQLIDNGYGSGSLYTSLMNQQRYAFQISISGNAHYYVNNALTVLPDIVTTNGVINFIDRPLIFTYEEISFLRFLDKRANLRTSRQFWYKLAKDPTYSAYLLPSMYATIFLVDEAGWSAVPQAQMDKLNQNKSLLLSVLSFHYCPKQLVYSDWIKNNSAQSELLIYTGFSTYNLNSFNLQLYKSKLFAVDNNQVGVASGGTVSKIIKTFQIKQAVIHIIDKPLGFIYETYEDMLRKINPALLSLCQSDAGCLSMLSSSNTMTVFVPSNQAMIRLNNEAQETKIKYLKYLFIPVKMMAADLTNMKLVKVDGLDDAIRFRLEEDLLYVDGRLPEKGYVSAVITKPDQVAINGVIHSIDNVPGLPYETVQTYLARNNQFSNFVQYGFVQNMTVGGPYTFLVPTNKAIESMNADMLVGKPLLLDQARRNYVFRRHSLPLILLLQTLRMSQTYSVATANYAFTREVIRLTVRSMSTNREILDGTLSMNTQQIHIYTANGPYQFKNGLIYPIDRMLYIRNDLTDRMCSVSICR